MKDTNLKKGRYMTDESKVTGVEQERSRVGQEQESQEQSNNREEQYQPEERVRSEETAQNREYVQEQEQEQAQEQAQAQEQVVVNRVRGEAEALQVIQNQPQMGQVGGIGQGSPIINQEPFFPVPATFMAVQLENVQLAHDSESHEYKMEVGQQRVQGRWQFHSPIPAASWRWEDDTRNMEVVTEDRATREHVVRLVPRPISVARIEIMTWDKKIIRFPILQPVPLDVNSLIAVTPEWLAAVRGRSYYARKHVASETTPESMPSVSNGMTRVLMCGWGRGMFSMDTMIARSNMRANAQGPAQSIRSTMHGRPPLSPLETTTMYGMVRHRVSRRLMSMMVGKRVVKGRANANEKVRKSTEPERNVLATEHLNRQFYSLWANDYGNGDRVRTILNVSEMM